MPAPSCSFLQRLPPPQGAGFPSLSRHATEREGALTDDARTWIRARHLVTPPRLDKRWDACAETLPSTGGPSEQCEPGWRTRTGNRVRFGHTTHIGWVAAKPNRARRGEREGYTVHYIGVILFRRTKGGRRRKPKILYAHADAAQRVKKDPGIR